jgi:hypothetical protein
MIQVGDGSRDFQDPVVCAGAQAHPPDCHFERPFSRFIQGAKLPEQARWYPSVIKAALVLDAAGRFHALAHFS